MREGAPPAGRLSIGAYLGVVAAYLVLLVISTFFTLDPSPDLPGFRTTDGVLRQLVLRMAAPLAFVLLVVGRLGWWRPVWVDERPVRPWLRVVPLSIGLTILGCTNYPGLARSPASFVLLLLTGSLMIGFAEELLFRGLGVTAFRRAGHRELSVAVWTSVLFSLAHAASLLGGPLQLLAALGAGFLYYLVRRVSGGLLLPAVLHGLWNFGILSAGVVEGEIYDLVPMFLLTELVLLVVVLVGIRKIEPAPARI